MEGRICSQVFVAALLCAAASFATLAASGDTATPADQAKQADQTKPAGKAKTAKPPASPPGSPAAGAASASKSSPGNDLTSPVAYIGDRSITLQDLALNLAQKIRLLVAAPPQLTRSALDEKVVVGWLARQFADLLLGLSAKQS